MNSKLSPRTLFLQDVVAKLPSSVTIKKSEQEKRSSGSPALKRKRLSSSSSSLHSTDIRKKVLERSMDQKITSMLKSSSADLSSQTKTTIQDFSIIEIEDYDIEDSFSLEEKDSHSEIKERGPGSKDQPIVITSRSPSCSPARRIQDDFEEENSKPLELTPAAPPLPDTPKTRKPSKSPSSSSLRSQPTSITNVEWIEVLRSKRKVRFYLIQAAGEDEGLKEVQRWSDKTKIPSCINGRKPFTIVPGIDYGHDEEVVGEDLDAKKDEEELKLIRNEQYLLDSFCCDAGYLSDEELNETPSANKVVSKVKQQRRANNIKEKRKFEKLSEPVIIGPYWQPGKGGCKKELWPWKPMVFSASPIPTGFNTVVITDQDDDVDDANDDVFAQEETDPVLQLQKPSSSAPASDPPSNNTGGHVETTTKNYDEKYAVKYFIKHLVQTRMRLGQRINNVPDPLLSSTPMIKKPGVSVTKVSVDIIT